MKFVCISDTHNQHRSLQLPEGDVLIHAGDFTTLGKIHQIQDFVEWFSSQPHPHKVLIAGNHDITLDVDDYERYLYGRFHASHHRLDCSPQTYAQRCLDLVLQAEGVTYLCNSSVTINGITIYGSPWTTPSSKRQHMAFQKRDLDDVWSQIPEGVDIVITHGPPFEVGDLTTKGTHIGNHELLYHLEDRIQPRVHVFGHNHEGFGISSSPLGGLLYINACTMTRDHRPLNRPVVFELSPATGDGDAQPAKIVEFVPAPRLPRTVTNARGVAHQSRHLKAASSQERSAPEYNEPTTFVITPMINVTGRALALDMTEALKGSPVCEVRHPHVTILFRKSGFSTEEALQVQQFIDEHLSSNPPRRDTDESGRPLLEFTLERWGRESDLIQGELAALVDLVYEKFQEWDQGGTSRRPAHVQLRRKPRRQEQQQQHRRT